MVMKNKIVIRRGFQVLILVILALSFFPIQQVNAEVPEISDADAVASDLVTLAATDISGANTDLDNIKVTLAPLPTTGANGTTISWESSNESILSNDGQTVIRPVGSGNASITLTATVSKNAESDTKVFNITVISDKTALTKWIVGGNNFTVGEPITFWLKMNINEGTTEKIVIKDILPAGMAFNSASIVKDNDNITYAMNNEPEIGDSGELVWEFRTIENVNDTEGTITVKYTAIIQDVVENVRGTWLTNTAHLEFTDGGGNVHTTPNTTGSVKIIEPELKIEAEITSAYPYDVGDTVTHRITISHTAESNATAYDVKITDILPEGLSYASYTADPSSIGEPIKDGNNVVFGDSGNIDLNLGASYTFNVNAVLDTQLEPQKLKNYNVKVDYSSTNGESAYERQYTSSLVSSVDIPDEETVNWVKKVLKIIYAEGDSADSVTQGLTLPTTGGYGTTISWISSNESILSNDGQTVNRPAFGSGDASIALTATVSKNAEIDTKVFNITVLEIPPTDAEAVAADLATLAATDISGTNTDLDNVIGALVSLPTTGANGTTISWISSNESILSNDGQTVNRPAFGLGDASITLTATVSKNAENDTKVFNITVLETPLTDAESVAADLATLAATDISGANTDLDNVEGALASLPTTGANGTTITWTSSNESIVSNDGQIVNRPAFGSGDAGITLTATVSENAESDTKVFNITVLEIPPTDAEAVAADLATLAATDISGTNTDLDNVIGSLASLPTTGANGTTISWESSNESILANDGQTVFRPSFGLGDASITLTATVSKNGESDTKVFNITVKHKSKTNRKVIKVTPEYLIKQGEEILEDIEERSDVGLEKKINDYLDKANELFKNQTIDNSTANDLVSKINEVIVKVVNKAGKIEGINLKVESGKGESTLILGSQKLIEAAENAIKTVNELSKKLEGNGIKELTKEYKAEIKIKVPEEIKKKEEVKVELPLEALNQLADKGIDILIEGDGVAFKIPSELVGLSTDNFIVEISRKRINDEEEQELKDSHEDKLVKNAVLELKNTPLDLNIKMKDEIRSTTTKIEKFNKQPVIEIPLDSIDLENVDINKLGIYVFDEEHSKWEYIKTEIKDGKLIAVVPHFSIYAVLEFNKEYKDTKGHWAKEDIDIMAAKHIVNYVYGEDDLKPQKKITRVEFTALIVKALGMEKNIGSYQFDDVGQDSWYANDIALAADTGIVNGIGNGQFAPNENITREQMAVMMERAYKIIYRKDMMVEEITFSDKDDISSWAVEAVKAAFSNNIVTGFDDATFKPQENTTRAQGIVMLKRLLDI